MKNNFIISDYIEEAMNESVYDKLEDNTYAGKISSCKGVLAFAETLKDCENELRSVLEDWILVGLKLGHTLPIISGIDLNKVPVNEQVDTL